MINDKTIKGIIMKKSILSLVFISLLHLCYAAEWQLTLDRSHALYNIGEEATFTISAHENGELLKEGTALAIFSLDGGREIAREKIDLQKTNPIKIRQSLTEAGFLRCTLIQMQPENNAKIKTLLAAAAFEPDKIQAAVEPPADFWQFWQNKIKESKLHDSELKLEKIDSMSNEEFNSYKISLIAMNNERVYGLLAIPSDKTKKYPLEVLVPGAGPAVVSIQGSKDKILLRMNILRYDFPVGDAKLSKEIYQKYNEDNGVYMRRNNDDKNNYYFLYSYLGILKAIDYVKNRAEWNQADLIISGSSQGGASSLILSALEAQTTVTNSNVPALCDHHGAKAGRQPGWPNAIANQKNQDLKEKTSETMAYFDAVNFAKYIKSPTFIVVGFIDRTCPASGVYAAYNQIKAEKKIIHDVLGGHRVSKFYSDGTKQWIEKYRFIEE